MKVAFICLHYGSDYLGYAIKSIYDTVDKILIAYSPAPSHGHGGEGVPNFDSRQICYEAAHTFGDPYNKIHWVDGQWKHEGEHRSVAYQLYPNARLICVVDADEIWHIEQFAKIQEWCLKQPVLAFKQKLRTPWRSFNWIVDDEMKPDRFIRPNQRQGTFAYVPIELGYFYHMGYCRSIPATRYKLSCHGHKNELRRGWLEEKYIAWSPTNNIPDLHPTCVGIWNARPFDKNLLPPILRKHPYWNVEVIA